MEIIKDLDRLEKLCLEVNKLKPLINSCGIKTAETKEVVKWFANNGELRAFKLRKGIYALTLVSPSGNRFELFNVFSGMKSEMKATELIKIAWNILGEFKYCTNNILKTPDEVTASFRGDIEYTFSNSKETEKTIIKNSKELTNILNSL